jgi:diguanylate cyclase (GGDEF)-like protein/PAS domain S-box-containing protein
MAQKKIPQTPKNQLKGEDVLRLIFVNYPVPMFVYDLKTLSFLDVNDSALEKYGYTRDEFLELTIRDIHAVEGSGEQRHQLKNGENMDVEVTSHPFEFEGQAAALVMVKDITQRKRDEEARQQSEASLKRRNELISALLENLAIGVFMVEAPGGKPLIANEAAMKLLGRGILPNASRENLSEVYRARRRGSQEPYPIEEMPIVRGMYGESSHIDDMVVERPDGSEIYLEVFGGPIKDDSGKIWASLVSFYDITERKQAEEALHESKLTAERYLNIAAEIIVALDHEGNITHLNKSGHQLLGYKEGLIGKNWFDACIPEEERGENRRFFNMLKNGEIQSMEGHENSVVTSNGDRKVILWHNTVLKDANGRFTGTLSSGEDITQRMEMEKSLRIALAKYKTLFEFFPLGITFSDDAGNILETNPTAERLLAVPRDEHAQRSIDGDEWHIIRPDGTIMPPDEFASVRALKEKQLIENVEMGIVKPDHSLIWLSVNAAPLPMEGHGVVISYSDITGRKRTENLMRVRLRLSQFSNLHSLDEFLQKTLDEAEALTGSQIGFAHFLEADQKTLELQMWSTNTIKNMCKAEGKGQHYPVEEAGVWVDCIYARAPVIHNDYASLPHRKGLPEGHAPVFRELVVPVIRNDLIVAIFGVGNKPANYTDEDVDAVLQLANLTWDIVQRKRTEEALKDSERKYRMLHESMIDGFISVDMEGHILEYNHAYRDMLGYSESELSSLTYLDITPEKWHAIEAKIVKEQILTRGYSDIYEKEYKRKDGVTIQVELRTVLLRNEQGNPVGMWAIVRDITNRKWVERALRESETRNRAMIDAMPDLIFVHNRSGVYIDYHAANPQLLAVPPQVFLGHTLHDIFPVSLATPLQLKLDLAFQTGEIQTQEYVLELANGRHYFEARINAYNDDRAICIIRDITERKQAEEALRENQELFSLFMKHSPIYAFIKEVTPTASRVLQASENYLQMIGISGEDMVGKTMEELFPPESAAKFTADDREVLAKGQVLKLDEELNGRSYTTIKFPIVQGDKTLLAGYTIDITERKQAEEALEAANAELKASLTREKQLAHTDMLTGVNNRRNLYEIAAHEFEIAIRYRQPLSMLMFDLDHFKIVNDTFGHTVGDQILIQVTQAACAELRSADSIGRYGGEEFVVLLPMTNAQQAFSLAERIRERVARIRMSTPTGDATVTLSIGIVEMMRETGRGESVDNMIRRADEAMYEAKQGGRNRSIIFNPDSKMNEKHS